MLSLVDEDSEFQHRVLKSLLQIALFAKPYRSINVKVVLAPEMHSVTLNPFVFPDASKLLWPKCDLFDDGKVVAKKLKKSKKL